MSLASPRLHSRTTAGKLNWRRAREALKPQRRDPATHEARADKSVNGDRLAAQKRNRFSPAEREAPIREVVPAKKRSRSRGDGALLMIAVFKFIKGAALLALAFGALSLLHKNVAAHAEHWLDQLRIDPDNQFIGELLSKLQLIHTKELKELSTLGAAYAALFLTEGTGLLFRKRWAEWLTVVATSSLLPLEVYELVKEFTAVRLLALLVNAAVVLYLIYLIRQKDPSRTGV